MKIFLQLASCFLALHTVTLADSSWMTWEEFKVIFNKTYKTEQEDNNRMKIFIQRQVVIADHDDRYERGEVTYKMGINKFSDLTVEEFLSIYTGFEFPRNPFPMFGTLVTTFPHNLTVPDEVNWVEKGAVTPVKDQGKCGSSYAFSATGAMEGQHFIKTGKLVSLSEQNIVDCSRDFGNNGCSGGFMGNVFKYVIENEGIDTEASYPYKTLKGECRFKRENIGATMSTFKDLSSGDENALKKAVATVGPISVAVDATNLMSYKSGIFTDNKCSKVYLNHGLLAVGYGTDSKTQQQYWLVKNSWGSDWGENGYFRIARNADNMCGIALGASYPIV